MKSQQLGKAYVDMPICVNESSLARDLKEFLFDIIADERSRKKIELAQLNTLVKIIKKIAPKDCLFYQDIYGVYGYWGCVEEFDINVIEEYFT